jgi:FAD binding domain in molybdopterin dehydrogenase
LKARAFSYARPDSIAAALDAFANAGGDATYIAGGQSLVPALALRLQAPGVLIDIAHIDELRGVELQAIQKSPLMAARANVIHHWLCDMRLAAEEGDATEVAELYDEGA